MLVVRFLNRIPLPNSARFMLTIAQIVIVGKIDSTVHCVIPEYVGFHTHEMSFLITFDTFVENRI